MTARIHVRPSRSLAVVVVAVATLAASALDARANCFTTPPKLPIAQPRLQAQAQRTVAAQATSQAADTSAAGRQIVGMRASEFVANTPQGPKLWDQGFELFHEDGTEVAIDNAVPPSLGNVCVGVWKSAGPRTIKLRHMAFNWNLDGTPAGRSLRSASRSTNHCRRFRLKANATESTPESRGFPFRRITERSDLPA